VSSAGEGWEQVGLGREKASRTKVREREREGKRILFLFINKFSKAFPNIF